LEITRTKKLENEIRKEIGERRKFFPPPWPLSHLKRRARGGI